VFGDPPAPVSNIPPPFIKGTIDNILAEVPNSRIGINQLNNHATTFPVTEIVSNFRSSNVKLVASIGLEF
jgi:hypothetical protein